MGLEGKRDDGGGFHYLQVHAIASRNEGHQPFPLAQPRGGREVAANSGSSHRRGARSP